MPTEIKPILYEDCRPLLRIGDIILYRPGEYFGFAGREWINRRIASVARHESFAPWQRYAHAGMVGKAQGVVELMEMLQFRGGRNTRLRWQVRDWPGQWDVYRPHDPDGGEGVRYDYLIAAKTMRQLTGTPYGYRSLFIASAGYVPGLNCLFDIPKDDAANGAIDAARHCSQAVSFACRQGGCDPIEDLADCVTTPNHLAYPDFAGYVGTLAWTRVQTDLLLKQYGEQSANH